MTSLQKLGIECIYDLKKPDELHYSISINHDKLRNPGQTRKYFTKIIDAISKDASRKGGLNGLTISVNREYLRELHSITKELSYKAHGHKTTRLSDGSLMLPEVFVLGGAITGGAIGIFFGYDLTTGWATDFAEYMNNASHLLAPITGLTQLGISVLGTIGGGFVGAGIGAGVGQFSSRPYVIAKTPLAKKAEAYQSLERALSQELR